MEKSRPEPPNVCNRPQAGPQRQQNAKPFGSVSRFHSYRLIEEMTDAPLTMESFLDSRLAQRSILEQINATADLLTNTPEEDTEDEDWVDCFIHTPLLSVALYDYLIEEERLPKFSSGGKRIVYQLASNCLGIEIVPSLCHDNAAMAITSDLLRWAESGGGTGVS
jgi:hypothetical protein